MYVIRKLADEKLCRLLLVSCLTYTFTLKMGRYISPKRRAVCRLHVVMAQKTVRFVSKCNLSPNVPRIGDGNVDVRNRCIQRWCGGKSAVFGVLPHSGCYYTN
jgi:hypothetical protein